MTLSGSLKKSKIDNSCLPYLLGYTAVGRWIFKFTELRQQGNRRTPDAGHGRRKKRRINPKTVDYETRCSTSLRLCPCTKRSTGPIYEALSRWFSVFRYKKSTFLESVGDQRADGIEGGGVERMSSTAAEFREEDIADTGLSGPDGHRAVRDSRRLHADVKKSALIRPPEIEAEIFAGKLDD